MWQVSEFEVEVRATVDTPARRYVTRSSADIVAELRAIVGPLFLGVDALLRCGGGRQNISLSEMLLWLNASGMAWVRLLEHCDRNPSDPTRAGLPSEVGGFLEEAEGQFAVPASDAITAEQAALVLGYWLECGGQLPGLVWS